MAVLSHRVYGDASEVIFILHGIFGMKDNWHHISGELAKEYKVITVDARNHGKSFHSHEMSYQAMADDLSGLMEHLGHSSAIVIGHSMGGKTAMKFASLYPHLLNKLVVVDIALKAYKPGHLPYFKAFEEIDFSVIQSRNEADQEFLKYEQNPGVRLFLLKNLEPRAGGGYQLRLNLPAIKMFYEESIGKLNLTANCYKGKTLFISGANSQYISETDKPEILQSFPAATFMSVPNAGHWVHADNPLQFLTYLKQFIQA